MTTPIDWNQIIANTLIAIPATMLAYAALRGTRDNKEQNKVIIKKADEIHELTNSNLDKVKKELVAAKEEIISVRAELVEANARSGRLERLLATFVEERTDTGPTN